MELASRSFAWMNTCHIEYKFKKSTKNLATHFSIITIRSSKRASCNKRFMHYIMLCFCRAAIKSISHAYQTYIYIDPLWIYMKWCFIQNSICRAFSHSASCITTNDDIYRWHKSQLIIWLLFGDVARDDACRGPNPIRPAHVSSRWFFTWKENPPHSISS